MTDVLHHLAQTDELIADDLVVLVQSGLEDVALGQLQIADALGLGGENGTGHGTQALAQVVQTSADRQAVLGEGGLAAAVDDLQEQLTHSNVDSVADEVGVQSLQNGLAGQDLTSHSGGVGHAGAADGLNEGLLDDAVLDVQAQLAGTLLGSAPAHTMGVAADVLNFISLYPFAFFGDGGGTVLRTFCDRAHIVDLCGVFDHNILSFA